MEPRARRRRPAADPATAGGERCAVSLPRFDAADGPGLDLARGVPTRAVAGQLVTTVYDLLLASYGVGRDGLPGVWPTGYDDPTSPCTPAWQEADHRRAGPQGGADRPGVRAERVDSRGRSMIIMGAGTNHYFHSDTIYRAFLALTTLTGCQGVNGGGWAHYVGQEKVRPLTGHGMLARRQRLEPPAAADDRHRLLVPRDRTVALRPVPGRRLRLADCGAGRSPGMTTADVLAQSARLGWMPSYPTFNWNPLALGDAVKASGRDPGEVRHRSDRDRPVVLRSRGSRRAGELPAGAHRLAGEPARVLGQGQRVLHEAPARRRELGARRAGARGPAAARRHLARRVAGGQARPAAGAGLPDDVDHAVRRRRPAGGDVVREARPVQHGHAPVRPRVQPGDLAALADPYRLRRLHVAGRGVEPTVGRRTWAPARTWSPRR